MITHDGINVEVCIDDVALPEYMVEEELVQKRVTCWIPSQTGKEFAIWVTNERQEDLNVEVKADGTCISGIVLTPQKSWNVASYQESLVEIRPFVFAKLELVDDDNLLGVSGCLQVGEIELICNDWRGVERSSSPKFVGTTFVENKKVHEQAKKGVEVHIGLGRVVPVKTFEYVVPRHEEHVVTFVLRYRPLDYLQAQGIAPLNVSQQITSSVADTAFHERSSSQEESLSLSDEHEPGANKSEKVKKEPEVLEDGDDDDDNIKALLTIVEEMKEKIEKIRAQKRKKKVAEAPRKKVKKEDSTPVFFSGQVIDLT